MFLCLDKCDSLSFTAMSPISSFSSSIILCLCQRWTDTYLFVHGNPSVRKFAILKKNFFILKENSTGYCWSIRVLAFIYSHASSPSLMQWWSSGHCQTFFPTIRVRILQFFWIKIPWKRTIINEKRSFSEISLLTHFICTGQGGRDKWYIVNLPPKCFIFKKYQTQFKVDIWQHLVLA